MIISLTLLSFSANRYTFLYNMSALLSLFIAPVCGLLIDYRATRGMNMFIFVFELNH